MIIIDECHHISAVSFEQILKKTNARYVYGLTATPTRKDGHHPIIFMQCGPVRYRDDAIKQARKRPFEHFIVPRFTSFRVPFEKKTKKSRFRNYTRKLLSMKCAIGRLLRMLLEVIKMAGIVLR